MDDKDVSPGVERILKSLVGLFDCTICYNPITQPSQIQCGHIFCSSCIKKIALVEKADAKCPNCRRKLNRRAVRMRDDITELNLAVRYLEETLMRELSKNNQSSVENCADLEQDESDVSLVASQPQLSQLPTLTQSQPMDLTMYVDPNSNLNQFDGDQRLERSTIKFVEPLDLSTKKRAREMISDVYERPENWRRSHPVFLPEDRESVKRQKLQDGFRSDRTESYYQPIPIAMTSKSSAMIFEVSVKEKGSISTRPSLVAEIAVEKEVNNKSDVQQVLENDKESPTKLQDDLGSQSCYRDSNYQPRATPPPVCATSVPETEVGKESKGKNDEEVEQEQDMENDNELFANLQDEDVLDGHCSENNSPPEAEASTSNHPSPIVKEVVNEKESISDSDTESDQDQVIPCTPVKDVRPVSPDSSNNNNDVDVVFNSRSTFASPLPSQWNINLSLGLESEKNESQLKRKFVMCPSRLNRVELAKLSELCSICDGTISKDYTDEVTHLIIKLEKGRVPHTMKYLFAIADKKWIVIYDWVSECAMQKEMVFEEPFESSNFPECDSGVRKSRVNPSHLFDSVHFYFTTVLKSSGATNEDCKKLIEKMGGTVVGSPFDVSPETGLIIIGEGGLQSKHLYQEWYKSRGCLSVSWTWVLDCLLTYSILPFTKTHFLTKLDGSGSINLPAALIDANSCTPLSSHFNGRR